MKSTHDPDRPEGTGMLGGLHRRAGHLAILLANAWRPQLSLGVRLLALDAAGRVFLLRHSYLPGLHLPGGAVDLGESCRDAAVREAREEGGLVLDAPPQLFGVYWHQVGNLRDHVVMYVARNARAATRRTATLEIVDAGFHALDTLPADITPATRRRIAEVVHAAPPSDVW